MHQYRATGDRLSSACALRLFVVCRLFSALGANLQHDGAGGGRLRIRRERHRESVGIARERERAFRSEQFDPADLARVVGAAGGQSLDRQFAVGGPCQREGVQRVPLGGEADVFRRVRRATSAR